MTYKDLCDALIGLQQIKQNMDFFVQSSVEAEMLKGRWAGLKANDLHGTPEENEIARQRCRQLLEGGYGAVDWTELLGER